MMRRLALPIAALILSASPAFATGWLCSFDRECIGGGECTPIAETIAVSDNLGPVTLQVSVGQTQATGRANLMEEGRVFINATTTDGSMVMMNVATDRSSDVTLVTMTGVRAFFGTCQEAQ